MQGFVPRELDERHMGFPGGRSSVYQVVPEAWTRKVLKAEFNVKTKDSGN